MSHDITAFSKNSGEKLSSLSIGAFNQGKSWILYESLDCNECNSGVSGSGTSKTFTEDKIRISISKFRYLLGEPENELYHIVKDSKPCRSATGLLHRVLRSIGARPSVADVKISLDRDSAEDVERFLEEIQNSGEVLVEFN